MKRERHPARAICGAFPPSTVGGVFLYRGVQADDRGAPCAVSAAERREPATQNGNDSHKNLSTKGDKNMAIIDSNGAKTYEGAVLSLYSQYHYDGMESEYAVCWDMEKHETVHVTVGYYGSDGYNFCGTRAEVDVEFDTVQDILHELKRRARVAFAKSVTEKKNAIEKGRRAVVVRGNKVKKGTVLDVFWCGERETYRSRMYNWMHETETVAGCYNENGEKVWIRAEYLKAIDELKSPSARERKKFINAYVRDEARALHIDATKSGFYALLAREYRKGVSA